MFTVLVKSMEFKNGAWRVQMEKIHAAVEVMNVLEERESTTDFDVPMKKGVHVMSAGNVEFWYSKLEKNHEWWIFVMNKDGNTVATYHI